MGKTTATDKASWTAAIDSIAQGMSVRTASKRYGIRSMSGLYGRRVGKIALLAQRGRPPQVLTRQAEAGVIEAIRFRALRGMCLDHAQLRHLLRQTALALHHEQPDAVPDTFPNPRWTNRFLKRNPSLSVRKAQIFEQSRHEGSTRTAIDDYYRNLAECMASRKYTPECIFNADETGVTPQGRRAPHVICPKGLRANTIRSEDSENVTIMGCCSASGTTIPPMFIFDGKNRKIQWLDGTVPGSVLAMSASSNIQTHLFACWLAFFVEQTAEDRDHGRKPALLLLDGHFAHLSLGIIQIAESNNIGNIYVEEYSWYPAKLFVSG